MFVFTVCTENWLSIKTMLTRRTDANITYNLSSGIRLKCKISHAKIAMAQWKKYYFIQLLLVTRLIHKWFATCFKTFLDFSIGFEILAENLDWIWNWYLRHSVHFKLNHFVHRYKIQGTWVPNFSLSSPILIVYNI